MAVQVIVEFTDAQWELVKEHYACYEDVLDGNQQFMGVQPQLITQDVLAAHLKTCVEEGVLECMRNAEREAKISSVDDAFKI